MSIGRITGGKSSAVSKLLNIIGMAMAFAALYIIMVQVHYDLGYNKKVKDSDRIFALAMPDWFTPGNWMSTLSRPLCEAAIDNVPGVECGGMIYLAGSSETTQLSRGEDGSGTITLKASNLSQGALSVFGFEAVEGRVEELSKWTDLLLSESKAKELGLHAGDVLYQRLDDGTTSQLKIAAVFKDYPTNSDLHGIDYFSNCGDQNIENFSEWSYPYFVKLQSKEDKEKFIRSKKGESDSL